MDKTELKIARKAQSKVKRELWMKTVKPYSIANHEKYLKTRAFWDVNRVTWESSYASIPRGGKTARESLITPMQQHWEGVGAIIKTMIKKEFNA